MYSSISRWCALSIEGLPDDPAGELHRDLRHLAAELLEHAVALGADLVLGASDDAPAASSSAFAWRSARSWSAVSRASSMMRLASSARAGELRCW